MAEGATGGKEKITGDLEPGQEAGFWGQQKTRPFGSGICADLMCGRGIDPSSLAESCIPLDSVP